MINWNSLLLVLWNTTAAALKAKTHQHFQNNFLSLFIFLHVYCCFTNFHICEIMHFWILCFVNYNLWNVVFCEMCNISKWLLRHSGCAGQCGKTDNSSLNELKHRYSFNIFSSAPIYYQMSSLSAVRRYEALAETGSECNWTPPPTSTTTTTPAGRPMQMQKTRWIWFSLMKFVVSTVTETKTTELMRLFYGRPLEE